MSTDAKRRTAGTGAPPRLIGIGVAEHIIPVTTAGVNPDGTKAPWAVDDRLWFAAHPDRAHRLRPAWPDEPVAGAAGPTHLIVIRQYEPGVRFRLGVSASGRPWPDDELFLHAAFDCLLEGGTARRCEIVRRAKALRAGMEVRQ